MKLFYPLKNCFLLSLFFIANISLTSAQDKTISNGLITIKTNTPFGTIYTYLPENFINDMPISGSFFIEPKGSSSKEIQKNNKILLEYSLELGESKIKLKDKVFSTIMKSDQIKLTILDGKEKLVTSINTNLTSKIQPKTFSFPEGIKSEDRTQIIGSFDGSMKNTTITINGQNAKILAESPIQTLIKAPKLPTGKYKIQVKENNKIKAEGKTQLVNYVLTAGKLNLKKGQSTHILATITGLNFLKNPIPLTVENMSPLVVTLQGGNSQKIMIPKQDETYTKRWNIRSIKSGSFTISTELKLPDTKFPKENLTIATKTEDDNPCKEFKKSCDELLADLNDKIALSDEAQKTYDTDKFEADKLKKLSDKLNSQAKKAEKDASPADESETITYEGYTYKLADSRLLKVLRDDANQDYKNGKTDVNKYQKRLKELSGKKALKEVEKNRKELEKKLEEIAKKAKEEADAAKTSYDKAAAEAKASKEINKRRLDDVWAAQRAYDECIKNAKDKCDKALAEKTKKDLEEKRAIEHAEQLKIAEEKRLASISRIKGKRREHTKYLLDNIKELGLIGSSGIIEVPGVWDWLPDFMENPVGNFVEDRTFNPIPTDVIKALGGIYNLVGILLNPCIPTGYRKTIERLEEMTNPYTNRKYTDKEAMKKTEEMCSLLKRLKTKSLKLKELLNE